MLFLLLLLLLLGDGDAIGIAFQRLNVDSGNFTNNTAGTTSGEIFVGTLSNITAIFYLGNDVTLTHAYNVTSIVEPTTLVFAVAMRDMTQMPNVTLDDVRAAVLARTCMSTLVSNITMPSLGGAAVAATNGTFTIGSLDSYGNTIESGDMMALDWTVYFTSPPTNQEAILQLFGQTQSFVLF